MIMRWFQLPLLIQLSLLFALFQIRFVSVVGPYMFLNILNYFPSPEIATYINIHVPVSLSDIMMSGLLLGMVL